MTIYNILHTYVNPKGEIKEGNANIIGSFSNEGEAIKQAERWVKNMENEPNVFIKRIFETQWYFVFSDDKETYRGYVTIESIKLDFIAF